MKGHSNALSYFSWNVDFGSTAFKNIFIDAVPWLIVWNQLLTFRIFFDNTQGITDQGLLL